MFKIDDFTIEKVVPDFTEDELNYLDLGGRKAFWSQGCYGQGQIIAIVDSGVSPHPEFENRLLVGKSFVSYTNSTNDDLGHGTHCAGSAAGKNVGMSPKAEILPVKVLGGDGSGEIRDIINALNWVNDWRHPKTGKKATVVSMSLSSDGRQESVQEMNDFHKAIQNLVANSIAVFCSAGNTGTEMDRWPASYPEVICVGAVDYFKKAAQFSTRSKEVDICQVGVGVLSAWYKGGYTIMSGTSMSTPICAGLALELAEKFEKALGFPPTEDFLWHAVKMNTKFLGDSRTFGAGFFTLQPLEADIWVQHNNPIMVLNGQNKILDVPAEIDMGRFKLPFRALGSATGAYIKYYPETSSAKIIH